MSSSGIQGQLLEVTVVGCNNLKDTEWISRQDPYVCVEYGSTKYRTRTHTDGGKNPVFQEKFVFTLIEGLRELNVVVWNSNTVTYDDFIGSVKIQLQKVLSEGFDDTMWTIHSKTGRYAGEVKLMMHFTKSSKPATAGHAPSAPPYYGAPHTPPVPQYPMHPPSAASYGPPPPGSYPAPSPYPAYPPLPEAYPPPSSYPPPPSAYLPPPSAYPPAPASYPPPYATAPYAAPPSGYPPAPYSYPHPPSDPSYYPPGSYSGAYPRPPY